MKLSYYERNKELFKNYYKDYYLKNKEKRNKQQKDWYVQNTEKSNTYNKDWYYSTKDVRDAIRISKKEYTYSQTKKKKQSDPVYRSICNLRARISYIAKNRYNKKFTELLGCSIEDARKHLEEQWQPGMSWDNYGLYGWHIDHIKPCNTFDLTDPDQQKKCFHYTNLRPLWAKDNLSRPRNGSDIL
jgi:hypothetical protein